MLRSGLLPKESSARVPPEDGFFAATASSLHVSFFYFLFIFFFSLVAWFVVGVSTGYHADLSVQYHRLGAVAVRGF